MIPDEIELKSKLFDLVTKQTRAGPVPSGEKGWMGELFCKRMHSHHNVFISDENFFYKFKFIAEMESHKRDSSQA